MNDAMQKRAKELVVNYFNDHVDKTDKKTITEDDPAGIGEEQDHRALSDARMASHLMIQMYRDKTYHVFSAKD